MRPILVLAVLFLALGCARVRVEAPKDPIKVDVSMRLDIYQHVAKDIDNIEDMISGPEEKPQAQDNHSLLEFFVNDAYAAEDLSPEAQAAVAKRKDRRPQIVSLEEKGIVGESKSGLLEIRNPQNADNSVQSLVGSENNDRTTIYREIAKNNGTSLEDVQVLYSKRLQSDAPGGTPIQNLSGEWKIK